MLSDQVKLLTDKINSAKTIAIMMHNNPDGDAVGSAIGLQSIIRDNFKKNPDVLFTGKYGSNLNFLPQTADMIRVTEDSVFNPYDLVIAVDTGSTSLISGMNHIFTSAHNTVKIDHHEMSEDFAQLNIREMMPAAAMVIFQIAQIARWTISCDAATALFTGITTDTVNFRFINNGIVFNALADLVNLGATPSYIIQKLTERNKDTVLGNANVTANAEFYFNGKLAIASFNRDDYMAVDQHDGLTIDLLFAIKTVEYVVILKEYPGDFVRISMRSKNVPVNTIAKRIDGGGHRFAAGAQIDGDLEYAKDHVLSAFEDQLDQIR